MLRWLTAGESHGPALTAIVEGLPAGVRVTSGDIAEELRRRRLGHGRGARMKFEQDEVTILGGVRHGVTLGGPVAIEVGNTEWPKWETVMSADPVDADVLAAQARNAPLSQPRPGHADLVGMQKYTDLAVDAPLSDAFKAHGADVWASVINVGAVAGLTAGTMIMLLGQSRGLFAMSRDGLLPRVLSRVHPRFQTPANAIITQTAWAAILTAAGAAFLVIEPPGPGSGLPTRAPVAGEKFNRKPLYDVLFSYVIFGATFMYALTVASVFVLRRRRPDLDRPYRTWGYPATPILYLAAAALLLGNMLRETFAESVVGLGIILAGVPAYFALRRRDTTRPSTP